MKAGMNVLETIEDEVLNVNRFFNDESGILFEEILDSYLKEVVERSVQPSYHDHTVNAATSEMGVA